MNTSLKIKQLSSSKARYRANEILRRIPNLDNLDFAVNIDVIKEEKINAKFLNKNQKAQRVQLQKNLHIYKKRLQQAIEQNKEKSIATNTKKIEEIEKQLEAQQQQVTKGRKKNFLEISLQLTNTHIDPAKFDNYNIFYEFIKSNRFTKYLDLKIAANHKDQHSIHAHFLFDVSNIDNFADYLRSKYKINDTREIYSVIQNDFHDFVSKYYDLDQMQTGRKYMSINKYKIFTAKIQKIKNFVDKIKKSMIYEIRDYFKFEKETKTMYEAFLNKKAENEQIVEKETKNDFRAVSEQINDISTSTARTKKYKRQKN